MRSKIRKIIFLGFFIIAATFSCKKDQTPEQKQAEAVKKYLEIKTKMSAMNANTGQMGNYLTVIGASQLKRGALDMASENGDPSAADGISFDTTGTEYWDFYTCAIVTETDNEDGTHTTVYDYGEGCDEFGSEIKGKVTYIWSNEGNTYYSKVLYDHYYSWGMEMNGYSEYSFVSDGQSFWEVGTYSGAGNSEGPDGDIDSGVKGDPDDSGDSVIYIDPSDPNDSEYPDDSTKVDGLYFSWSGTSSGKEDIEVTMDSGEKYSYTSDYSNKWDNTSYTVLSGDYSYISKSDRYEFHYEVTSPLVSNYECPNTWVAVSGIEHTSYTEEGKTTEFTMDYGDGTCDNLALLTENGEESIVDFSEMVYEFCGTDSVVCVDGKENR